MDNFGEFIPSILTAALAIAAMVLGAKYILVKSKVDQFKDVLESWDNMWEDDNATSAEWEDLAKKIKILLGRENGDVIKKN